MDFHEMSVRGSRLGLNYWFWNFHISLPFRGLLDAWSKFQRNPLLRGMDYLFFGRPKHFDGFEIGRIPGVKTKICFRTWTDLCLPPPRSIIFETGSMTGFTAGGTRFIARYMQHSCFNALRTGIYLEKDSTCCTTSTV